MRPPPAPDMSSNVTRFWRSYVYIGVLTYSMGAAAVLGYSLATPEPHQRLMVILSGASLLASVGPFRLLGLRLTETRWSTLFFTSWALLRSSSLPSVPSWTGACAARSRIS